MIGNLQIWNERDVSRPLDGTKQQPRSQLADILNPHQIASRLPGRRRHQRATAAARRALTAAAAATHEAATRHRRRVRLGSKQHGHEA